jgi:hypothetical protein
MIEGGKVGEKGLGYVSQGFGDIFREIKGDLAYKDPFELNHRKGPRSPARRTLVWTSIQWEGCSS